MPAQSFVTFTQGGEGGELALPPPLPAAARLRELGVAFLRDWASAYGSLYAALPLALRRVEERAVPVERSAAAEEERREGRSRELQRARYYSAKPAAEEALVAARDALAALDAAATATAAPVVGTGDDEWEDVQAPGLLAGRKTDAQPQHDAAVAELLGAAVSRLRDRVLPALEAAIATLGCSVVDDAERAGLLQAALGLRTAVQLALR